MTNKELFEQDEEAWIHKQVKLLTEKRLDEIDIENIVDLLVEMSEREWREMHSRLLVLFTHILKWQYQPKMRSHSWSDTIAVQQGYLKKIIKASKKSNPEYVPTVVDAYQHARRKARTETGMSIEAFPVEMPWTVEEALSFRTEE